MNTNQSFTNRKVVIVGAGLSGTLMAILLAKRGADVQVIERADYTHGVSSMSNRRSFNITISSRGRKAMKTAGVWDLVEKVTIPITGRMCHMLDCSKEFPYSKDNTAVLNGARRADVNDSLLDAAHELPNIQFKFAAEVVDVNKVTGAVMVETNGTVETIDDADFFIGADGVFSKLRTLIHKGERAEYHQKFLDWGYKEVKIPPAEEGAKSKYRIPPNALHVWPRGDYMMFALPNPDGSLTGNFIFPMESKRDFETPGKISKIFRENFPDVVSYIPDIEEKFAEIPVSFFPTQKNSMWFHGDKFVLLGDAAHSTVPFYGQGMNSALESAVMLVESLEKHGLDNREAAFEEYQKNRKPHTDAVADLSIENFLDLRSNFKSLVPQARRRIEVALHEWFPNHYHPLHMLVSHTETNYQDAIDQCKRRDLILRCCGMDILVYSLAAGQAVLNIGHKITGLFSPKGEPSNQAKA